MTADANGWQPIDSVPQGSVWLRHDDVIALVNVFMAHGGLSYGGWGFACGLPTHWKRPDPLPAPPVMTGETEE